MSEKTVQIPESLYAELQALLNNAEERSLPSNSESPEELALEIDKVIKDSKETIEASRKLRERYEARKPEMERAKRLLGIG